MHTCYVEQISHANYVKTKKLKIQTLEINKFVGELNPIL